MIDPAIIRLSQTVAALVEQLASTQDVLAQREARIAQLESVQDEAVTDADHP